MKIGPLFLFVCFNFLSGYGQQQIVDTSFESLKGHLEFPVKRYTKLHTYEDACKRSYERLSICGPTPSLTIISDSDIDVYSVAPGVVSSIFEVDSMLAVFVRHGRYFFAYHNLDTVLIKKGDILYARQLIGKIKTPYVDQSYELYFTITDENVHHIDPFPWFKKDEIIRRKNQK